MQRVHETEDDLVRLQALLDRSYAQSGEHLRSITTPQRRIDARELGRLLGGVQVIDLATVTPSGAPRVSPVDGLFYRAHFYFGSSTTSARYRNLRAHPQVSAAHTRGEELSVVVHGTAQLFALGDPDRADFRAYAEEVYVPLYGDAWREFVKADTMFYARIEPERMFTFRMDQPSLSMDKA